MKKYFITTLTFILMLAIASCLTRKAIKVNNPNIQLGDLQEYAFGKYRVVKIDSIGNLFLIYAAKNDSIYKIVSVKENTDGFERITINRVYGFRLHSLLASRQIAFNMIPNGMVNGVDYYGTVVYKERGCVDDIFFSDNIKGVKYFK